MATKNLSQEQRNALAVVALRKKARDAMQLESKERAKQLEDQLNAEAELSLRQAIRDAYELDVPKTRIVRDGMGHVSRDYVNAALDSTYKAGLRPTVEAPRAVKVGTIEEMNEQPALVQKFAIDDQGRLQGTLLGYFTDRTDEAAEAPFSITFIAKPHTGRQGETIWEFDSDSTREEKDGKTIEGFLEWEIKNDRGRLAQYLNERYEEALNA